MNIMWSTLVQFLLGGALAAGWWVAAIRLRDRWFVYALAVTETVMVVTSFLPMWAFNSGLTTSQPSYVALMSAMWLLRVVQTVFFLIFVYWLVGGGAGCMNLPALLAGRERTASGLSLNLLVVILGAVVLGLVVLVVIFLLSIAMLAGNTFHLIGL